jgi:hypothetical protein
MNEPRARPVDSELETPSTTQAEHRLCGDAPRRRCDHGEIGTYENGSLRGADGVRRKRKCAHTQIAPPYDGPYDKDRTDSGVVDVQRRPPS